MYSADAARRTDVSECIKRRLEDGQRESKERCRCTQLSLAGGEARLRSPKAKGIANKIQFNQEHKRYKELYTLLKTLLALTRDMILLARLVLLITKGYLVQAYV